MPGTILLSLQDWSSATSVIVWLYLSYTSATSIDCNWWDSKDLKSLKELKLLFIIFKCRESIGWAWFIYYMYLMFFTYPVSAFRNKILWSLWAPRIRSAGMFHFGSLFNLLWQSHRFRCDIFQKKTSEPRFANIICLVRLIWSEASERFTNIKTEKVEFFMAFWRSCFVNLQIKWGKKPKCALNGKVTGNCSSFSLYLK